MQVYRLYVNSRSGLLSVQLCEFLLGSSNDDMIVISQLSLKSLPLNELDCQWNYLGNEHII